MRLQTHLRFTASSNQGDRRYMEDVFHYHFETKNSESTEILFGFFAIFDGHGGSEAAKFAKEKLLKEITTRDGFWSDDDQKICQAIRDGFLSAHAAMWDEISSWPKTASGLPSTAGTTATVCFLRDSKLYIGHVGDSGVVLGKKDPEREDWITQRLTREHKPESPCEKARIEALGGAVVSKAGVQRVVWKRPKVTNSGQPGGAIRKSTTIEHIPFLSVSRSLGDLWSYDYAKDDYYVSPEPDVHVLQINPHVHKVLILASDGLWNMLRPQDAIGCVQDVEREMEKRWFKTKTHNEPVSLINPSQRLVRRAVARWRDLKMRADNTTALTILIDPPGPRKEEVVRRERHGRHLELVDGYSRTDYIIQNINMLRELINADDSDASSTDPASPKKLVNVTNTPSVVGGRKMPLDSGSEPSSNGVASGGVVHNAGASAASNGAPSGDASSSRVDGSDSPRENREPASPMESEAGDGEAEEPPGIKSGAKKKSSQAPAAAHPLNGSATAAATAPAAASSSSQPARNIKLLIPNKLDNGAIGAHPRLRRSDNVAEPPQRRVAETKTNDAPSASPLGFSTPPAASRLRGRAILRSRPSLPASLAPSTSSSSTSRSSRSPSPRATRLSASPATTSRASRSSSRTPGSNGAAKTATQNEAKSRQKEKESGKPATSAKDSHGDLSSPSSSPSSSPTASPEKRINTRSVTKNNLPIGERMRSRKVLKRKMDIEGGGGGHEAAEAETLTSLSPMDQQFVWDVPKKKARVSSGVPDHSSTSRSTRGKPGSSETPSSPRRPLNTKNGGLSTNQTRATTNASSAALKGSKSLTSEPKTILAKTASTKRKVAATNIATAKSTTAKSATAKSATAKSAPAKSASKNGRKSSAANTQPTAARRSLTVEALKAIKPRVSKQKAPRSPTTTKTKTKPKTTTTTTTTAAKGRRKTMHL